MSTVAPDTQAAPSAATSPLDEEYTPLYADITKLAKALPVSHIPTINDLAGWVGAVVAYLEHGHSIIQVARDADVTLQSAHDAISAVLTQNEPPPVIGQTAGDAANLRIQRQQQAELDELKAQLAALTNTLNQSTVDALKAATPVDPAPVAAAPGFTPEQAPVVAPDPAPAPVATTPSTAPSFPTGPSTPPASSTPDQEGAA